jgi:mono/diheme cytochrome c family protein
MIMVLVTRVKKVAFVLAGVMIAATFLIASARVPTAPEDDAAALYKTKCVACHGATAEKRFDPALADADLVQIVLKGKKAEKPPNMPAYDEKGITEDQAKALVAFMKTLKK